MSSAAKHKPNKRKTACYALLLLFYVTIHLNRINDVVSLFAFMSNQETTMATNTPKEGYHYPTHVDNNTTATVHMVVIADAYFAKKYHPIFVKNEQYANRHGYKWHVIGQDSESCTKLHRDFFFRKHCMIAEWMEETLPANNKIEDDIVVVFDSDVVPYRPHISLDNWILSTSSIDIKKEDIILYERIWNTEIMAGNYIVRNNQRARSFLREWANYEYEKPTGFSSSDNGAIHLHVRRVVGLEDRKEGPCGKLYHNLTASVNNLDPYYEFVDCARQNVTAGKMEASNGSGLTLLLLGKAKAWAVDGVYDPYEKDVFGPVFHHGVKVPLNNAQARIYGFNVTLKIPGAPEVLCGGHNAPNCTMCTRNSEGAWVGKTWCNGDCSWTGDTCILSNSSRVRVESLEAYRNKQLKLLSKAA